MNKQKVLNMVKEYVVAVDGMRDMHNTSVLNRMSCESDRLYAAIKADKYNMCSGYLHEIFDILKGMSNE
jgi:hypothetical protein